MPYTFTPTRSYIFDLKNAAKKKWRVNKKLVHFASAVAVICSRLTWPYAARLISDSLQVCSAGQMGFLAHRQQSCDETKVRLIAGGKALCSFPAELKKPQSITRLDRIIGLRTRPQVLFASSRAHSIDRFHPIYVLTAHSKVWTE